MFNFKLLLTTTAAALLFAASASAGAAGPNQCVAFDSNWNLLAFNFDGKDYIVAADDLAGATGTDITSSSRPPFNAPSSPPLCFLSQYTNSIYVLNADSSDASSIYIFDVEKKSWTKQATTLPAAVAGAGFDLTKGFNTILDRDTNVFYGISTGGMMVKLDMALKQNASADTMEWDVVQNVDFAEGYEKPTMALAQNHIHFMGVPGLEAGVDRVFVIHYSYLQPEPQTYTPAFPHSYGRTASFFKPEGWQTQFAFVPSSLDNTYVVDVATNTTTILPAPPVKDENAQYTASPTALVQLSSEGGKLSFIGWDQEARRATGEWVAIKGVPEAKNTPGTALQESSGGGKSQNGSTVAGSTGSNEVDENGALERRAVGFSAVLGLVGALALWVM